MSSSLIIARFGTCMGPREDGSLQPLIVGTAFCGRVSSHWLGVLGFIGGRAPGSNEQMVLQLWACAASTDQDKGEHSRKVHFNSLINIKLFNYTFATMMYANGKSSNPILQSVDLVASFATSQNRAKVGKFGRKKNL